MDDKTLVIIDSDELDELKKAINQAARSFEDLVEEFRQLNMAVSNLYDDED
jgi:hypothetical protein|tara:strand:+ start:509 stop:661 length:153 start_codon:yes stop_codon:yes gene_type:complete